MRIGIVNEFFYPDETGGTGAVLSSLARYLQDNFEGVQLEAVTSRRLYRRHSENLPAEEDWRGIRIHRLAAPMSIGVSTPRRLWANLVFSIAALWFLLRQPRYDVLLVSTAPPPLPVVARLLNLLFGTPYLYVVYDLEPDRAVTMQLIKDTHPVARCLRALQRQWLHHAGRTIVLGRCMRERLIDRYGLAPQRVEVIAIGSDPEEIYPLPKESAFRAKLGLEGFVVVYSGNFGRYHNFDTILDAAGRLQRSGITFALVGGGSQQAHIAERIEQEALSNVRLMPFVPQEEYNDLLASADVSLVTLEPGMEGICVPSKFYSILASGRPTIAMVSPNSEVAYVLAEANCGLQIGQGDTDRLVSVLQRLSHAPQELERMGQNARRVLLEKYSLSAVAERYYFALLAACGKDLGDIALAPLPLNSKTVEDADVLMRQ